MGIPEPTEKAAPGQSPQPEAEKALTDREVRKIARQAGRGAIWQFLGGGWHTVVRLAASTVLARVLAPQDFGLFGMALLAKGILSRIGPQGMGTGIIAKKAVTEEDLCTCFWTVAGVRFVMFLVAWLGAPLAGTFFGEPKVVPVLRAVAVIFVLSIIGTIPRVLLNKELRFKAVVISRAAAIALESGTAIVLAVWFDMGYWSLVYALIGSTLAEQLFVFAVRPWVPRLVFSRQSFRYLFRYGASGLVFSIFNYLTQNIDYIIVGRILGPAVLGLYEFAYRIPHMVIDRISRPVGRVVFPALSKVQDRDDLIVKGYIRAVQSVIIIAYPLLGFLAVMAEPIVRLLWGEQWLPIVAPMRILCVTAALRCLFQPLGAVFNVKKRPDLPAKFSMVRFVVTLALVLVLGRKWGLTGVAYAMLLSVLPSMIFAGVAFRFCGSNVAHIMMRFSGVWTATILSVVAVYLVAMSTENSFGLATTVFVGLSMFVALYVVLLYFVDRALLNSIYGAIRSVVHG